MREPDNSSRRLGDSLEEIGGSPEEIGGSLEEIGDSPEETGGLRREIGGSLFNLPISSGELANSSSPTTQGARALRLNRASCLAWNWRLGGRGG